MSRYNACPGSWRMEREVKEEVSTPEQREWAASGHRIHLWLDQPNFIELSPEELEVAKACLRDRDTILAEWAAGREYTSFKEARIWLKIKRRKELSGKSDITAVTADGITGQRPSACIVDYKTNRGDIEASDTNLQLRTLAVLGDENYGPLEDASVAISQPLTGRPVVCKYSRDDLDNARIEVLGILEAIKKPDALLNPGTHCKYCPARVTCPKSKAVLERIVASKTEENKDIGTLLLLCETAKPIIKAIEANAKAMLKNGVAIPGWILGKPSSLREIVNPVGAYEALFSADLIDRDTFMNECIGVSVGDLEKAVAKFKQLPPKDAKEAVNTTCVQFINIKQKEPSLEKEK